MIIFHKYTYTTLGAIFAATSNEVMISWKEPALIIVTTIDLTHTKKIE
jgi:hypothetical protein